MTQMPASAAGRVRAVCRCAGAITAALAMFALGCGGPVPERAAPAAPAPASQIVTQPDGSRLLSVPGPRMPGMTTAEVTRVELPGILEANGQVAFDEQRVAAIVARVAGRIEQTRLSQWDNVRRGERIIALYSPDFMTAEAEYLQAQTTAKLSSAPALAVETGGASPGASMLTAARRKLELLGMDGADIAALRMPDPIVWMRAPASGTVVENRAVRGAAVSPGDVLYSLGTLGDVWIVANIYEDDLARVRPGQQLDAVTAAFPDETFSGTIARISPGVDPNTHTVQIRCAVGNQGGRLKPAMLARVRIITDRGLALVVPMESLVFDTDGYYAYVDRGGGTYERRKVEVGSWKERGMARVLSGLHAGERVVASEAIEINALWHQAGGEGS